MRISGQRASSIMKRSLKEKEAIYVWRQPVIMRSVGRWSTPERAEPSNRMASTNMPVFCVELVDDQNPSSGVFCKANRRVCHAWAYEGGRRTSEPGLFIYFE